MSPSLPEQPDRLRELMQCCPNPKLVHVTADEAVCESCGRSWGVLLVKGERS